MTINVQLMQTLIQLQAMQAMNSSSSSDTDSIMGTDPTDSFSSILTALLEGDSSDNSEVDNSTSPLDLSALAGANNNLGMLTQLLGGDSSAGSDLDSIISPLDLSTLSGANNDLGLFALQPSLMNTTSSNPTDYDQYITNAAAKYNVDPKLIKSVISNESGFDPMSVSSTGAVGLMQLMPGTARSLGVTDPFDPQQNIDGGTKYLREMLDTFGNNKMLAVAAYNAGPGSVQKYNGVPPFQETQNYVRKVLQSYMS